MYFSKKDKIIECVANFSEGKNTSIIQAIKSKITSVPNVKILHVDQGIDANRTVITFAGIPENLVEAAFLAIKTAGELIDMTIHKGEHSRIGATDVCPLIPIANVSLEETIQHSKTLAQRAAEELSIPIYLYEHSTDKIHRKNLAAIRVGQYEGLQQKMMDILWKPDFGIAFNAKSGATVIGARDVLIAFNINLNTADVKIAKSIAGKIRESGMGGKKGVFKGLKAIGWYMDEYKEAQVSMNIVNIHTAPLHLVFDEVCKQAADHAIDVVGCEPIGLLPLDTILDAGKHFRRKAKQSTSLSNAVLIDSAIQNMRLDYVKPFIPEERILEYCLYGKKI